MEIGIYTFGELGPNTTHADRTRQLVEEMALADGVRPRRFRRCLGTEVAPAVRKAVTLATETAAAGR
jgi:hypothetical protein